MSTDLAVIEAALKAATPGPWEASGHDSGHSMYELDWYVVQPEAGDAICDLESYERVTCNERHAQTTAEADAHLIANAPTWLAELLERVKAAEAEVERLRELDHETAGEAMMAAELRSQGRRRAVAEATIARVWELVDEHPGTAWNSGLNLRQALRDALGGTPTDAPEGADSADDERNRFSDENPDDAPDAVHFLTVNTDDQEPKLELVCTAAAGAPCRKRPTDGREEWDLDDPDIEWLDGPCFAVEWIEAEGFTDAIRCEEGAQFPRFPIEVSYHDEGPWIAPVAPHPLLPLFTDQRYEPPADDHESGCCRG